MIERRDVESEVEGGDYLRGWLFVPAGTMAPDQSFRWRTATRA